MKTEILDKRYCLFKQIDAILLFMLIFSYAYFFVYIIPWIDIVGKDFSDIKNYMERIEYLRQGLPEREFSGIGILFSEYLWKYISIAIGHYFNDYRAGLYLVSFISLSLYSFFTFRRVNIVLVSILLITPMFIDLVMGQLRMSIAFPLLLMGYELRDKKIFFIPILIAIFIHSASFIFIGVFLILRYMEKEFPLENLYRNSMILAFLMAFFMKWGVDIILVAVGSPKAHYNSIIEATSISYSLVWFILALVLVLKAPIDEVKERVIISFSITMMSFFFFASIFGVYGQRYVAISIPLIIIAISYLPKHYKQAIFLTFLLYQFLQFKYWFSLILI